MIHLFLLVSGFSALVYEVVWAREMGLLLGHTIYAVSAVLVAFMAGLALGSRWVGRRIDLFPNPLRVYAYLELGIGALAVLFPLLPLLLDPLYSFLYRAIDHRLLLHAARFAVATAVLIMPTTLMGGSLPAVAAWCVPEGASGGAVVGRLYAVNTLGATLGCLAAGFLLIERLGTIETQWLAAAANGLVGGGALLLARGPRPSFREGREGREGTGAAKGSTKAAPPPPTATSGPPALNLSLLMTAVFVSGAAALAYEVVWTRMLVFFTGTTTYAFTSMLAIYLAGLALGSLVAARIVERVRTLTVAYSGIQMVIGATGALSPAALGWATPLVERWFSPELTWPSLVAGNLLKAGAAMFVPTLLLGALFPLAVRLSAGADPVGARVGRLYSANTLGAIAGAPVAAFALIPALGMGKAVLAVATANVIVAAAVVASSRRAGSSGRWLVAACAAMVALVWSGLIPVQAPLHRATGSEKLLYYAEGNTSTVSVLQEVSGTKTLYIDQVPVAGTDPIMLTDQKSLAHLPMLLHPDPRRVLTVGFGSGGASWSFARYDRLEAIDCVEIDPSVFGAAPHLTESNHEVWTDPRFRLIIEDARNHLAFTGATYDIISTDCTDLRYKTNAALYTSDYFGLCRRRLRSAGMVVVWMPLGGLAEEVFKLALRSFRAVFPHATIWYLSNYPTHYALLVGTVEPRQIDLRRVLDRLAEADVRSDLAEIGLDSPAKLLSGLLLDETAFAAYVGEGAVNSDHYPYLEFLAPRHAYRMAISDNLRALAARRSRTAPLIDTRPDDPEALRTLADLERAERAAPALLAGHALYQRQTFEYEAALVEYRRAAALDPADPTIPRLIASVEATRKMWMAEYEARLSNGLAGTRERAGLATLYLEAGRVGEARRVLEDSLALAPRDAGLRRRLAAALAAAGDTESAIREYEQAIALETSSAEAHNDVGLLYLGHGASEKAVAAFRRATQLDPGSAAARHNLGMVKAMAGDLAGAEADYREALKLDPRLIQAHGNLAALLARAGRRAEAIRALEALLAIDPSVGVARRMLEELRDGDSTSGSSSSGSLD